MEGWSAIGWKSGCNVIHTIPYGIRKSAWYSSGAAFLWAGVGVVDRAEREPSSSMRCCCLLIRA